MYQYDSLYSALAKTPGRRWVNSLPQQIEKALQTQAHKEILKWQAALTSLPNLSASSWDFDQAAIRIGETSDCDQTTLDQILQSYRQLMPWRKGPYELFGELIDSEWRSDLKWDRLIDKINPLIGKLVLDVGCGNGYHCWRMLGKGASRVVGIDPTLLFVHQFYANKHFLPKLPIDILPLSLEQVPENLQTFDTVFSMGVLYHRRSPIDHLIQLRNCLKPGGQLVLETLVVPGKEGFSLVPTGRYAGMKNVWFIPTIATLTQWLRRCGFGQIKSIDTTPTNQREQRTTDWIKGKSLINTIDSANPSHTVEGYPAPLRATIIASHS